MSTAMGNLIIVYSMQMKEQEAEVLILQKKKKPKYYGN